MTNVMSFDIGTGKMIKKYDLNEPRAFLNDLTVLANGDVYITESMNSKLYKIKAGSDSIQLFAIIAGC